MIDDGLLLAGAAILAKDGDAYAGQVMFGDLPHLATLTPGQEMLLLVLRKADAKATWRGSCRLVRRPGGYSGLMPTTDTLFRVHVVRDGDGARIEFWAPLIGKPPAPHKRILEGSELATARLRA